MSPTTGHQGIVLVCLADGTIQRVLRDDLGLSDPARAPARLGDLADPDTRGKLDAFLLELQTHQAPCNCELGVRIDGAPLLLQFAGAPFETGYMVVAAGSRDGLSELNEELMRINNEQTNALRSVAKDLSLATAKDAARDTALYEELTRLNNEMANLQRELARKNAELARYFEVSEEEQGVASALMSQLVRTDMLQDPLLHYWIQPAHNLSGDLIAAARTPEGVLHVLLADGTGHGLAASLNVLPMVDPFYAMTAKGYGLGDIAREANAKIKRWLPAGRFVAAALIAFDPRRALIEVWCGGLPPPFLLDPHGRMIYEFANLHLSVGVLSADEFDARTELLEVEGSVQLIVCSDGATEAEGADGTQFGRERLLGTLRGAPADERLDHLKRELSRYFAGASPIDDISVAIVDCAQVAGSSRGAG